MATAGTGAQVPDNPVCIANSNTRIITRCSIDERLIKLSDLETRIVGLKNAKNISTAEAIRGRIGCFTGNDENLFICKSHLKSVVKNFKIGATCGMPVSLATHSQNEKRKTVRSITFMETETVFRKTNTLIPVGKGICHTCREEIKRICVSYQDECKAAIIANRDQETGFRLRHSTLDPSRLPTTKDESEDEIDDQQESMESEPEYNLSTPERASQNFVSSPEEANQRPFRNEMQELQKLSEAIGVPKPRQLTKSMANLSTRRQRDHIQWRQQFDRQLDQILCPSDPDAYRACLQKVENTKETLANFITDGAQSELMKAMATAYLEANNWENKRRHLSIIASAISLEEARKLIPHLSYNAYKTARRHAFYIGIGAPIPPSKTARQRYSATALEHFVTYICSSLMISDLPFGEKTLKLSSGELVIIPNVIRNFAPERIVQQYFASFEEEKKNNPDALWFEPLSRATILRVLEVCKASQRKSMQGLDYFTANGSQAFDDLIEIVTALEHDGHMQADTKQSLLKRIKFSKDYLKGDYKSHVRLQSQVPDHCIYFALSSATGSEFRQGCCHKHDQACDYCDNIKAIFDELRTIIGNIPLPHVEKSIMEERIDEADRNVKLWKSHLLRVINQDRARSDVCDSLAPRKDVFVISDWAMKYLPRRYRETMAQFFGKRGMPWHVAVAFVKDQNGKTLVRTFIHHFEQCKLNSVAVVAILSDVLQQLKSEIPTLENAFLRSDNAGCYHAATTILSINAISEKSGIKVLRYDFSDPQGGKADCDRAAATIKRHLNLYVSEKHDIVNAQQFFEAGESHGGIRGTSFHSGNIELSENSDKQNATILGINSLNNFTFRNGGVTAWQAYDIGKGKTLDKRTQLTPEDLPSFVQQLGTSRTVEWRVLGDSESNPLPESESSDEISDDEVVQTRAAKLFLCPEGNCSKKYRYEAHLERHLLSEKHQYKPMRQTLLDDAVLKYRRRISEGIISRRTEQLLDNMELETTTVEESACSWALKIQKSNARFSEKQRNYLVQKFNEGEETGNKLTGEQVATMMRKTIVNGEPIFTRDEWLDQQQIMGFFSRLAAKRHDENEAEHDGSDTEVNEEAAALREARIMQCIYNALQNENNESQETEQSNPVEVTLPSTKPKRRSKKRCAPNQEAERQSKRFDSDSEDESIQRKQLLPLAISTTSAQATSGTSKMSEAQKQKIKQSSSGETVLARLTRFVNAHLEKRRESKAVRAAYKDSIRNESRQRLMCQSLSPIVATESTFLPAVATELNSQSLHNKVESGDDFCIRTAQRGDPGNDFVQDPEYFETNRDGNCHQQKSAHAFLPQFASLSLPGTSDCEDVYTHAIFGNRDNMIEEKENARAPFREFEDGLFSNEQLFLRPSAPVTDEQYTACATSFQPPGFLMPTAPALHEQPSASHLDLADITLSEAAATINEITGKHKDLESSRKVQDSLYFPEVPAHNPWLDRLPDVPADEPELAITRAQESRTAQCLPMASSY